MSASSDERLMAGIKAGDREAFGILLERHWSRLVVYATEMVGGSDDAQDVVQEVFARVWRRRAEWTATGSAAAYLYRITRNLALNSLRARRTAARWRERVRARIPLPHAPLTPAEDFEAASLREEVERAVAALPERRREVFVLARFHGLSHDEIAEAMGTSRQTVANQMSAALHQLRRTLAHRLHKG